MTRWLRKLGLAFTLTLASQCALSLGYTGARIAHESFADLGEVALISPDGPASDLLLVLDQGESIPVHLYSLARDGHLIAHININHFLDREKINRSDCIDAVTLLDVFSQHLQQKFRFAHYQRPILIGIDAAAPLALATLAQAPNRLFQAGAGIRLQAEIALPAPPCATPALSAQPLANGRGKDLRFAITSHNPGAPWQSLDDIEQLDDYLDTLTAANAANDDSINDLALVELPVPKTATESTLGDTFVILLSGDGGWANIDKDIGEALNARGLPVIGWNSLQYFWREKTPEQASRDLARAIAHYQKTWRRSRVLLVGFSLGADVLPFMISRLPDTTRAAIADTVFLGLAHQVDFQFHVTDWLGGSDSHARPITPELAKLAGTPLLCIYGKDDDDTICDEKPPGLDVVQLPGDHHFNGDYERATQLILDHLRQHGRH